MKALTSMMRVLMVLLLASSLAGCKKKPKIVPVDLVALKPPAGVIIFGGIQSLQGVVGELAKLGGDVTPAAAGLPAMLPMALKQRYGLTSAGGLELNGTLRFAVCDPETYENDPVIILLPTRGQKAFLQTLPASKKKNVEGNAYSHAESGQGRVYYNFVGTHVAVTSEPALFAKYRSFLAAMLESKLSDALTVVGSLANANTIYGPQLKRQVKALAQQKPPAQPQKSPDQQPPIQQLQQLAPRFVDAIGQLDRVTLKLQTPSHGLKLLFALAARDGTPLAKIFGDFAGRSSTLAARLPKDALVAMGGAMDMQRAMPHFERLMHFAVSMMQGFGELGQMPEMFKQFAGATDGQFAFVVHPIGEDVAATGLYGVRDAKLWQAVMSAALDIYEKPTWAAAMSKQGMQVKVEREAYKVGDVSVATITTTTDQARVGSMGPLAGLFSSYVTHLASGPKLGVYALGSQGRAAVEGFLNGSIAGGLDKHPAVQRAQTSLGVAPLLWGFVAVDRLAAKLSSLLTKGAAAVPSATGSDGITFSVASVPSGGTVSAALDIPRTQVQSIASLGGLAARSMLMARPPQRPRPAIAAP